MGAKRPPLKVQEVDGSPSGYPNTLKVSNGTLTDNGDGTFTLVIGAAGAAAASGVDVTSSGTQSIPASTSTALLFDTETTDTDAYHSTVTNTSRLTVPTGLGAAFFNIAANATFAASATGTIRTISLKKNGTVIKTVDEQGIINTALGMEVAAGVYLADGDYIEVFVYQDSVGAVNIATGATFSMIRNGGPAGAAGSAFSPTYLGRNVVGGTRYAWPASYYALCRKITAGSGGNLLLAVEGYVDQSANNVGYMGAAVWADASNAPGQILHTGDPAPLYLGGTGGTASGVYPARWYGPPLAPMLLAASTSYWIGLIIDAGANGPGIYRDAGGHDVIIQQGGYYASDGGRWTQADSTYDLSIRALVVAL